MAPRASRGRPGRNRLDVSEAGEAAAGRRANKRASAFRTIGEVAEDLDLPAHVLRFWESKFPQLRPLKRGGGRRYYRPEDIDLLRHIRQCLYQDGYTIRGVQKLLREGNTHPEAAIPVADEAGAPASLFPLVPGSAPVRPAAAPRPARKPAASGAVSRQLSPAAREALEEVCRELLDIRTLLHQLARRRGG
jgi:DNA-binding transcriptional MerR regulator